MSEPESVSDLFQRLLRAENGPHNAYQALENAGVLSKVTVHRYFCRKRHCPLATVIRINDAIIVRYAPNKLSPGLNKEMTVEGARRNNTLDGKRHWPGHTLDIGSLAKSGQNANVDMNCRHVIRTVLASDLLAQVEGVRPGHPGPPTLL